MEQVHKIFLELGVSSPLGDTLNPPIVMGNKHDQQTSVMGLRKRPTHFAWTGKVKLIKNRTMIETFLKCFEPASSFLTFSLMVLGFLVGLASVFRYIPSIPEPSWPIKTPFGKLPFFDGVILYGAVMLIFFGILIGVLS